MSWKKLFALVMASYSFLYGAECCSSCYDNDGHFYLLFGTGPSFSTQAKIYAPPAVWALTNEGYNASLGIKPIIEAGFGYEFLSYLSADIVFAYRPDYKYYKFQTTAPSETRNTQTRTRHFNLDIATVMFSLYVSGRGIPGLCWSLPSISSTIYPIIGGGVGTSRLTIYNFLASGYPPTTTPFPSFASENAYTVRYRFTYQLMGGFEYRMKNNWAFSLGYRWFDPRHFDGPRYIRDNLGNTQDVLDNMWRIKFKANEIFFELKVFL